MNYNKNRRIYIYSLECFADTGFSRIKIGQTKKDLPGEAGVLERVKEQQTTGVPHKIKLLDWWESSYIEDTDLHRELELIYGANELDKFNEWFTLSIDKVKETYNKLNDKVDLYAQIAQLKMEKNQLEKELVQKNSQLKSIQDQKNLTTANLVKILEDLIDVKEEENQSFELAKDLFEKIKNEIINLNKM
jgi:hypothetical protein